MLFDQWSDFVLRVEGNYSDEKHDRGGKTWFGFTEAFLDSVNENPPQTKERAKRLLYQYFWQPHHLADMDWFVAWCYGDALINHSPRSAAKCLQAGLQVKQDGAVGPITIKAASPGRIRRSDFWLRYAIRRTQLYFAIVRSNQSQQKFLKGWINRLHLLSTYAYRAGYTQ